MKIRILFSVLFFFFLQLAMIETLRAAETVVKSTDTTAVEVKTTETPKESEIALFKDKANKAATEKTSTSQMLMSVVVIIGLVGAAFVLMRKYAYKNRDTKNQPKIKVLTQHHLGPKKSLAIIHVAGESILIGITDHNVNLIKSLSLIDDEVPQDMEQNFQTEIAEEAREQFTFSKSDKKTNKLFSHNLEREMENM